MRGRSAILLSVTVCSTIAALCVQAQSTNGRTQSPTAVPAQARESVSIGRHHRGKLLFARELTESATIRFKQPESRTHHGTDELVTLLERAAAAVAAQFPGARLTIGDLSRSRGGPFRPHRSHRSGRDVDIGFYIVDDEGNLAYAERFVDFLPDGRVRPGQYLSQHEWRFDIERNWLLIQSLLSQEDIPVQHIFIARALKARLLEHAQRLNASPELLERVNTVLDQPSRGGKHDDHFHLRIFCPLTDIPRCVDSPPFYPWVARPSPAELAEMRARANSERWRARRHERRERETRESRRARRGD